MTEFVELLIWGAVLVALGLRSAARGRSRKSGGPPETGSREPIVGGAEGPEAPSTSFEDLARTPERSVRGRPLVEQWLEAARELEEEARWREEEAGVPREWRESPALGPPAGEERTLTVPGRRVRPAPARAAVSAAAADLGAVERRHAVEGHTPDPRASRRALSEEGSGPEGSKRGSGRNPLARLDRLGPLRRAVVLSEILGPPPGLTSEERSRGRWEP